MMPLMRTLDPCHLCSVGSLWSGYQGEGSTRAEAPWMRGGDDGVVRCLDVGPFHELMLTDKCFDASPCPGSDLQQDISKVYIF
jgi:hypothetical protein